MLFERHALTTAFAALVLIMIAAAPARSDVVTEWNAKAEAIAAEKRLLPPPNARGMAILHVAMFEAVNAVERRYAPYRINLAADKAISRDATAAAAAAAAHAVLLALHPDRPAALEAALSTSLAPIAEGESKAKAIELGKKVAAEILASRANDGANSAESYRPVTAPGVYVPTIVPVSSTYGGVTPWVMYKGSQFRPAPPPVLYSATWTNDLNEIREVAGRNSSKRTPEQTEIARFWFMTGPQAWNPIVRQLAKIKKLDLVDSARLFALVAMAADDAFIAVFDAKYHYNLWRPITAIRNADQAGNAATPRDASWLPFGQGSLPLGDTPMHPEYPCAHCITSSAVGAVLKAAFGNDIPEVTMTSPTAPGVTRKWTRISDYTDEVSVSRIYAGFHYRFSTKVGEEMGRQIGELTVGTRLRSAVAAAEPRR
jgi:PAP2 superfamily